MTGSLIPQTTLETFKPVITISAEDIKNRGFNNVQEALANASVATGGVQGNQIVGLVHPGRGNATACSVFPRATPST